MSMRDTDILMDKDVSPTAESNLYTARHNFLGLQDDVSKEMNYLNYDKTFKTYILSRRLDLEEPRLYKSTFTQYELEYIEGVNVYSSEEWSIEIPNDTEVLNEEF